MKKMYIAIPLFIVFLLSLFLVSCGQDKGQVDASKLEQQIAALSLKVEELSKKVDALTNGPGAAEATGKKMKAGFIYVGPVGDYGWSHAHDQGRKFIEKKIPLA